MHTSRLLVAITQLFPWTMQVRGAPLTAMLVKPTVAATHRSRSRFDEKVASWTRVPSIVQWAMSESPNPLPPVWEVGATGLFGQNGER